MTRTYFSIVALLICLSFAVSATANDGVGGNEEVGAVRAAGKKIVTEHCARCHGITRSDKSTHKEAPEFREIANRYSVWLLAESLAEGIVSGHPDMPEFVFDPDEINAILSYMDSLADEPGQKDG